MNREKEKISFVKNYLAKNELVMCEKDWVLIKLYLSVHGLSLIDLEEKPLKSFFETVSDDVPNYTADWLT